MLVLAGAGSGKTRVITQKIAYLIKQQGMLPDKIAAVTFTNKAAREMRERVGKTLKHINTRGLIISTFHNLGLRILRTETEASGLRPGFTIYDMEECNRLLGEISVKALNLDKEFIQRTRQAIGNWKNQLITPDQAISRAEDDREAAMAVLYREYQHSLLVHNAVDFDDLLLLPVTLFQNHAEVLATWHYRLRYLLVDEYQDTNGCQYELVKLLIGNRPALTVVGDDDQSIYSWRGARPDNLAKLQEDFPTLQVIKLEQNYRSTGRILRTANALISNNPHLFKKKLWSDQGYGDPIRVIRAVDEEDEARLVISELLTDRMRFNRRHGDYAILYRSNHQSRVFEKVLREHGIPYLLSGGTSFFSYTEVKDILAYLRLLANADDNAAFLRVINTPRRQIGASTVAGLSSLANNRGLSLHKTGLSKELGRSLDASATLRVQGFCEWLSEMSLIAEEQGLNRAMEQLLEETAYEDWLKQTSENEGQAERRMRNVRELTGWIAQIMKQANEPMTPTDVIDHMALMDALDRKETDEQQDAVQLATLHAAKGLEFPHVFMVGLEENLLPHKNSLEVDGLEEERRLAYVGITRAQKSLYLSFTKKRKQYGEWLESKPSRFLEELPPDDLEWRGQNEDKKSDESREIGRAHLANLKALLGK